MKHTQRISLAQYKTEQFYKMPKWLFGGEFQNMSNDAKIAYMLLKDRNELSIINNWVDDNGDIFLIYTRKELAEILGVGLNKATAIFKELTSNGLIEETRQGLTKANRIYVCTQAISPVNKQTLKNEVSENLENKCLDTYKLNTNKTDTNNTKEEEEEEAQKQAEFDVLEYMSELIEMHVSDVEQQSYLKELLSEFVMEMKKKTKPAIKRYILAAIKQHGKTYKQPEQKTRTHSKRVETLPTWDNEAPELTPEQQAEQLKQINELMKDLK